MEYLFRVNAEELNTAVWKALTLGYRFLPHDRVVSVPSELESIHFITLPDVILRRIALRQGHDWFHLVKNSWDYQEYSTTVIHNQYRGEMEVVDQRSWGPYIDFQVRRVPSRETDEFKLMLHLYPRFWEPAQEREHKTPQQVKKDFSVLRSAIAPSHKRI